jgi:translation initiation factor IF-2
MTVRVHELAKELKLSSKELIEKLKALKIDAKSHMSVLTDGDVKTLKETLKKSPAASKTSPAAKAKPITAALPVKPPAVTPSIESAKRELLLQRQNTAKSAAAAETKRPFSAPSASSATTLRRVVPTAPAHAKPKPQAAEAKKPFKAQTTFSDFTKPAVSATVIPSEPVRMRRLSVQTPITVKDLAEKMSVRPSDVIQRLIKIGIFASINQSVNFEVAAKVAIEFGFELQKEESIPEQPPEVRSETKDKSQLVARASVVTFMGHVDHGKTSLLDAIRKTKVAASEAGGITQHIGAYEVFLPKGAVTFLDTPGHEAFTQMRARGARVTDVVVLVVAADDGVMPQTLEAIDHAKAAGVPIIVAINKIDLPSANPDRVKKGLMEHGLMSEDWGGKTIMLNVSAKTGKGIDELLEMLVLESELLELKANPSVGASGVVIEAELSKGSGVLATVLVQDGTLRVGDVTIVGNQFGKIRAMINDRGQRIKEALPSMPVEILGLASVPKAGDQFYVVKDERRAKEIMEEREVSGQNRRENVTYHITLEHLLEDIKAGKAEELKLILKSDVQGSVEALRNTLGTIKSKNVRLNIIHSGIGDISESDVLLAAASNAVVIGFHVGIVGTAHEAAEKELVDVRFYEIIYEVKTAIEKAMEGLLLPEEKEVSVGIAEVRQVFKVSKIGVIAGCTVQKGKIVRNSICRVVRNGQKIHDGKIESLKRFKDDAREVLEGFECGIGVSNFDEILAGDRIETYEIQKKARKLE